MSRRITALNNTGIKSLQSGFYAESIRSFRMAIECLNSNLQDSAATTGESSCCFCPDELPLQAISVKASVDAAALAEASPHNTFEIYQTAFAFPKLNHLAPLQTEVSVILFYNLAVSHHLAGLSDMEQSQLQLKQALKYYKLALLVFKSTPDLALDTTCFALVLGLLTNLGHVLTHFWNKVDAAACRQHMHELLRQAAAVAALSEDDGEFFFNALEYSQAHDAVAAPAA